MIKSTWEAGENTKFALRSRPIHVVNVLGRLTICQESTKTNQKSEAIDFESTWRD